MPNKKLPEYKDNVNERIKSYEGSPRGIFKTMADAGDDEALRITAKTIINNFLKQENTKKQPKNLEPEM